MTISWGGMKTPNLAFNADAPVCSFYLAGAGGGAPVN